jgi:hypothetical protein
MKKSVSFIFGVITVLMGMGFLGCPMDSPSSSDPSSGPSSGGNGNGNGNGGVGAILERGTRYLLNEDYDRAVESYKEAYAKDNSNAEAIVYSVLGELAAISIDPKVKNLMQDRLGVKSYPATMGALFSDSWMENYPDEEEENRVPGLQVPDWFKTTGVYLESKITGGVESYTTWSLLLAANLLDKNTSGLNGFFDDILSSVFGTTFEDLFSRAQRLKDSDTVELDTRIIEKIGLDEILEGDVIISKAELDVLLAGLRIVKASFEWLASYNWDTDFSFLKFNWNNYEDFLAKLKAANVSNLPFRNGFLKNQNVDLLNKSKADYIMAVDMLIGAYNAIGGKDYIPDAFKDEWNNYSWIRDGLQKLRTSITDAAQFWIPENIPTGSTYPNTKSGALLGIDMGKFFTPDYFTLEKLVEPEGNAPKFYGLANMGGNNGTHITNQAGIDSYEAIGFKLTLGPVKALILEIFDDLEDNYIPMPKDCGKVLYELYH